MHIPYVAEKFPTSCGPTLKGSHRLSIGWQDIVWAAITAGKPNASHLLAHRWHSFADIVVRSHTIYANLREHAGCLKRSSLYEAADPTEKGATSYFIGMTMAKLFADRLLNTPWVFHASIAKSSGASISYKKGSKSQPDLIGQNTSGQWVVLEAKGRTHGFSQSCLDGAKSQTRRIRHINGVSPYLRVAVHAYFDNELRVHLADPDSHERTARNVQIDVAGAMSQYYSIAAALTRKSKKIRKIEGRPYVIYYDLDSGVTVGVEREVLELIRQGDFNSLIRQLSDRQRINDAPSDRSAIYSDGLLIELDERWSSNLMNLNPEARGG